MQNKFEREIYAAILGEKKVQVIEFLCQNADSNGFVFIKIDELCKALNISKPTAIQTFKLLESKKIFERVKNGLYRFKNLSRENDE